MMMMIVVAAAVLMAGADSACLTINDFNREALGQPVSFSTIGEMYGDDNSIAGAGGVFRLQGGQLVVQPPARATSYWFMEFEPHCIVPSSTPIRSSNKAYSSFGGATTLVFDLEAAPGADIALSMAGGVFAQCDAGTFVSSEIRLSSRHQPDGVMRTVAIPLSAWDNAQLKTADGVHSVVFSFAPNPTNAVYRFDNIRLCQEGSDLGAAPPSPLPVMLPAPPALNSSQPLPEAGGASTKPNEVAASQDKAQQPEQRSKGADNGPTSDSLNLAQISSLTVLALAAACLVLM